MEQSDYQNQLSKKISQNQNELELFDNISFHVIEKADGNPNYAVKGNDYSLIFGHYRKIVERRTLVSAYNTLFPGDPKMERELKIVEDRLERAEGGLRQGFSQISDFINQAERRPYKR